MNDDERRDEEVLPLVAAAQRLEDARAELRVALEKLARAVADMRQLLDSLEELDGSGL